MSQVLLKEVVQVKPASEASFAACRKLLPEALKWGKPPEFLLANTTNPLRFQGAAAFAPERRRADGRCYLKFAVRVAKPYRGSGIGSLLLAGIEATALRRGIDLLSSTVVEGSHDEWGSFLSCQGFFSVERQHTFEVSLGRMAEFFLPRRDWLVQRGEVPTDVSVVSLQEAPRGQVAKLLSGHHASAGQTYEMFLRRRTTLAAESFGFALVVDGEIQGAIVHRIERSIAIADTLVISPSFRGDIVRIGWANVLLSARAIHWYLYRDVRRVRFVISDSNPSVMKQYKRFNPEEIEIRESFEKAL